MQKDKKSFVLFMDLEDTIDNLSDGQAGKIFKAIFDYQRTGETNLKGTLKTLFLGIKNTLDRNEQKWEEIRKKRSEAGKRHTGNQYTRTKQNEKQTNLEQMEQNGTNGTVSVSGSVNVNDNVSVSVSGSVINNNITTLPTPTLDELRSYCLENGMDDLDYEYFYNYYESNGWVNKNGNPIKNWKSKIKIWYKDDKEHGKLKGQEKKYDTKTIFTERETGRDFQYDEKGNKHYVDN